MQIRIPKINEIIVFRQGVELTIYAHIPLRWRGLQDLDVHTFTDTVARIFCQFGHLITSPRYKRFRQNDLKFTVTPDLRGSGIIGEFKLHLIDDIYCIVRSFPTTTTDNYSSVANCIRVAMCGLNQIGNYSTHISIDIVNALGEISENTNVS